MRVLTVALILGMMGCTSSSSTVDQSVDTAGSAVHASDGTLVVLGQDQTLEELLSSKETVLVDFYATWCGPCQTLGNTLHELQEFAANNNARIVKVNVDEHRDIAEQFEITRLPTVVLFKDGTQVDRHVGRLSDDELKELIQR